MLIDANQLDDGTVVETDLCIIGAGPAGISCAAEFLDTSVDVCLLESGGRIPEPATQSLAGGSVTGHQYVPLESTRVRMLGGTSSIWSGWCRPLDRIDFEERQWIPNSGWPLTLDSLSEYYKRAQVVCGIGPFKYNLSDWSQHDPDAIGAGSDRLAAKVIQMNRVHFGREYRSHLRSSKNTRTILHANVLTIDADPSAQNIQAVTVGTLSGKKIRVKAKNFVIATGGLENARLLLLSDQVQKTGLGNGKDLVGRFFINHTFVPRGYVIGAGTAGGNKAFSRREVVGRDGISVQIRAYLAFRRLVQEHEQIANISFCLERSDLSSLIYGSGQDHKWYEKIGLTIRNLDEVFLGSVNRTYAKLDPEKLQPVFSIQTISEQTPNSSSRVTLTSKVDRLGQRRINLDWRLNDIDFFTIKRSHILLGAELARTGTGRVVSDIHDQHDWQQEHIGDWHHIGTTRMSNDPSQGVVNADCRVHGIDNLYVAGSSVFPTGGYANPTLTIIALAIRLADHIKGAEA